MDLSRLFHVVAPLVRAESNRIAGRPARRPHSRCTTGRRSGLWDVGSVHPALRSSRSPGSRPGSTDPQPLHGSASTSNGVHFLRAFGQQCTRLEGDQHSRLIQLQEFLEGLFDLLDLKSRAQYERASHPRLSPAAPARPGRLLSPCSVRPVPGFSW